MFKFSDSACICVSVCVCECVCVCVCYADCTADHGWHINYRGRYVAAVVGRDGTLIASKEDLSVRHGDICHSTGTVLFHPTLFFSFFFFFFGFSLTISLCLACPIWTVTNKTGRSEKKSGGEKAAAP